MVYQCNLVNLCSELISNIVADIEGGDNLNESDNLIDSGKCKSWSYYFIL